MNVEEPAGGATPAIRTLPLNTHRSHAQCLVYAEEVCMYGTAVSSMTGGWRGGVGRGGLKGP